MDEKSFDRTIRKLATTLLPESVKKAAKSRNPKNAHRVWPLISTRWTLATPNADGFRINAYLWELVLLIG